MPEGRSPAREGELPPGRVACLHCGRPIKPDVELCPFCRKMQTATGAFDGPREPAPGAYASLLFGGVAFAAFGVIAILVRVRHVQLAAWFLAVGLIASFAFAILAIVKGVDARTIARNDPRFVPSGAAIAGLVLGVVTLAIHLLILVSLVF